MPHNQSRRNTRNPVELDRRQKWVRRLACRHGWTEQPINAVNTLRFVKPDGDRLPMIVEVFYSTAKVATVVNHPKKKRNKAYRQLRTYRDLERVFENPRVHDGKTYRRKKGGQ